MSQTSSRGFSLMEMMVAAAIFALVAVVAIPSYESYVARSRQSLAKNELSIVFATEKRFYGQFQIYHWDLPTIGYVPEGRWADYGAAVEKGRAYALTLGPTVGLIRDLLNSYGISENTSIFWGFSYYHTFAASPDACGIVSNPEFVPGVDSSIGGSTAFISETAYRASAIGCPRGNVPSGQPVTRLDRWSIDQNRVLTNSASGI